MHLKDFTFELPTELIAQAPPPERGLSRLMVVDPQHRSRLHLTVRDLPSLVEPGTLMVFNDTRVRKARIFGETENGGKIEAVFLRPLPDGRWECLVNRAKKLKPGQKLRFPENVVATIESPDGNVRTLNFDPPATDQWIEAHGHLPLPPYIKRPDNESDESRYQTVYARQLGSAAAPTAGLHFTEALLRDLNARGVEMAFLTLEVGLGTFLPVRVENLADHKMHTERYWVPPETSAAFQRARSEGRPVLAVGTTSLRTLESAWKPEGLESGWGATDLFLTPGCEFRAVDQLFTNFHTPESTLLMLVCAFAGQEFLLESYREAIEARFRFFSYGDAMLLTSKG